MKKLIFQIIISSILIINSSFLLFGQEEIIHGNVTTFETFLLSGVSIKVKSTKKVVFSDTLGRFTALCLSKDKLKVSARGFSNQNVKIDEKTKYIFVNLKLKPGPENRELAIGYGYVKDRDKLDAMSSLNEKDTNFSQYSNIYEIIRGRFSSVQIINDEIIIRGGTTILGSSAALLIVDGVEVDRFVFGSISTADVASINILKGSDAAIYGSRGANGVVIVETKTGEYR